MASSAVHVNNVRCVETITVTFTTATTYTFRPEHPIRAITLQGDGNDNGGTLSLQGSNDGVNFFALPTAVALTAAGLASTVVADMGYLWYRVNLSNITGTSVAVVNIAYNQ
jgi:hypothetical protein